MQTTTALLALVVVAVSGVRVGPESFENALHQWLGRLVIHIPNTPLTASGMNLTFNGTCTDINVSSIAVPQSSPQTFVAAVHGIAINCDLHWIAVTSLTSLLQGYGMLTANVTNTNLSGSVTVINEGIPPLPVGFEQLKGCSAMINIDKLTFDGDVAVKIISAFQDYIKTALTLALRQSMCLAIQSELAGPATTKLKNFTASLRQWLAEPSSSKPANLPGPTNQEYVNFASNPGVIMLNRLCTEVLENPQSPNNMNSLVTKALGGGNLSLAAYGVLPVSFRIPLATAGALNVTVKDMALSGLNTWLKMVLGSAGPHGLYYNVALQDLVTSADVKLLVIPNNTDATVQAPSMSEDFIVNMAIHGVGTNATWSLGVNQHVLSELAVDQYQYPGCVAPAVVSAEETQAGFNLGASSLELVSESSLEQDVDSLLNKAAQMVLEGYAAAVEESARHFVSVSLRDKMNTVIEKSLADVGPCPDPAPNYQYPFFSETIRLFCYLFFALGIITLSCIPQCRAFHKRRTTSTHVSSSNVMELTENLRQDAPAREYLPEADPVVDFREEAEVREVTPQNVNVWALVKHPRIPLRVRAALPLLVISVICLFAASNSTSGADVLVLIRVDGQDVVSLGSVYSFSLISSIKEMWEKKVYPLALLIILFSGIWPYVKLLTMLACWFLDTAKLSIRRRQFLLDFLDTYGKWSLVDVLVLVVFMVAFKFDLATNTAVLPEVVQIFDEIGMTGTFQVIIQPGWGYHAFCIATIGSLILGHVMKGCHRYALQIGEFKADTRSDDAPRLCRLCDIVDALPGKRRMVVHGPTIVVLFSLLLACIGIFLHAFQFKFLGLAGFVLGEQESVRPFSVFTLAETVATSSPNPGSFGMLWIQFLFALFTMWVVILYHVILLFLWRAPLTDKCQRYLLVTAETLNAWSGLDVFVVTELAAVMEIETFAVAMVGHACDPITNVISKFAWSENIPGGVKCFDVISTLEGGFYVLAVAAVVSQVVGNRMLHRCAMLLCPVEDEES